MTRRVVCLALTALLLDACSSLKIVVPEYQQPGELVRLEQGWSGQQWLRFHHTPQGTRLLPYSWFVALEQPCFSPGECALFKEQSYLGRFGFLASESDSDLNPDGLPVGFARQQNFTDPNNGKTYPVIGLNCAACHTAELQWDKYAVRIEGGPGMIELAEFQKALGLAMLMTKWVPFRFGRFETRILGPNASEQQRADLKEHFEELLAAALAEKKAADDREIYANAAGFGRTDALARIGNQVFAVDMKRDDNLAPANAPVNFPHLWDASWFTWVQYNSSISQPMVRNVGEALGVRALAKLYGDDAGEYRNSIDLPGLKELESLLSGAAPFEGLQSPRWPDVFPPLDAAKVARGEQLYRQRCIGCHLPPMDELKADLASQQPAHWWQNSLGKRFLIVTDVPIERVGTDPLQATDFLNRQADSGDLKLGRISAVDGLKLVTGAIADKGYAAMGLSDEQRLEWNGWRAPEDPTARAAAIYKARPLDGVWATAPFLHNGSVPNLYELLSPRGEREPTFWLGSKRFDPVHVGFETTPLDGGYELDTSKPGNSNQGHEFKDDAGAPGVIGPALSPEDRSALVEYLKSI